jgi:hypothetical protein
LQILGAVPDSVNESAAIYRKGHSRWDLKCGIAWGAIRSVEDRAIVKRRLWREAV